MNVPERRGGEEYSLDSFIQSEDQESWGSSTGHRNGDCYVLGLNADERIWCCHAHITCNVVDKCEYFDKDLFKRCKIFEPNEEEMWALCNYELDANDKENQHTINILAQ
ncbi:hypothetical protein PAXRUDRAFT_17365 [Paxillus rubicundulus Ve08.2h10]|uniref:Uncharacterized protein n=1 Tax=Paxillus rubicundulus Ve08.2h10 TaxID=930991 RepID=A0A0D0C3A0_9AGAM|nr:hypothetical protein PAXRUDRAFT_17365 [Paxillus rubicundulus Ve08.2h10]